MPSGTLMNCCKILHLVMSQSSSGVTFSKFKTVFTRLVRPGFIFKKSFICSLYLANIIMGFLMFGFSLLFMLAISVSTASFPKSRLGGVGGGGAGGTQGVCLVYKQGTTLSFLNDFCRFADGASNMFGDEITTQYLQQLFHFL